MGLELGVDTGELYTPRTICFHPCQLVCMQENTLYPLSQDRALFWIYVCVKFGAAWLNLRGLALEYFLPL